MAVGLVGIDDALQDFIADAKERARAEAEAARLQAIKDEERAKEEARVQAILDEAQCYLDANPMQAAALERDPQAAHTQTCQLSRVSTFLSPLSGTLLSIDVSWLMQADRRTRCG